MFGGRRRWCGALGRTARNRGRARGFLSKGVVLSGRVRAARGGERERQRNCEQATLPQQAALPLITKFCYDAVMIHRRKEKTDENASILGQSKPSTFTEREGFAPPLPQMRLGELDLHFRQKLLMCVRSIFPSILAVESVARGAVGSDKI